MPGCLRASDKCPEDCCPQLSSPLFLLLCGMCVSRSTSLRLSRRCGERRAASDAKCQQGSSHKLPTVQRYLSPDRGYYQNANLLSFAWLEVNGEMPQHSPSRRSEGYHTLSRHVDIPCCCDLGGSSWDWERCLRLETGCSVAGTPVAYRALASPRTRDSELSVRYTFSWPSRGGSCGNACATPHSSPHPCAQVGVMKATTRSSAI